MPIDSHADLFALAKDQAEVGKFFKQIGSAEKRISDARLKLSEQYDIIVKIKSEAKRFMEELAKKIEDLGLIKSDDSTGVDKSKIEKDDIKAYKDDAAGLEEDVKYCTALSEALKTSTFQAANVVEKFIALGVGYEKMGDAHTRFIKADKTLFEKKDKLSDKKGAMEDAKANAGREFDQAKSDIDRRKEELSKEMEKLNQAINAIVDAMKVS
jgi:hypothetical protein